MKKIHTNKTPYIVIAFDIATLDEVKQQCDCWTSVNVVAADEGSALRKAKKQLEDGVIPICGFTRHDLREISKSLKSLK